MLPYDKSSDKYQSLVKAVCNYVTSGLAPIFTVDKPAFRQLLKALDPRFNCPSRNHFSSVVIPEMYSDMKSSLVSKLSDIKSFSCTMDGWSSLAGDPYLSLTIHFINNDWKIETACLSTMYVPESHTGDNLCEFVREGLLEYGLYTGQMIAMTTDAAANNISACRKLSARRVSCFGHILHNALCTTFSKSEEITCLLKSARKIVSVFSYSSINRQQLLKIKKELKIDAKSLVQDVSTRWGSKFKMLSRLLEQLPAVDQLFVNNRKHRDLMLSFAQKDLLTDTVNALRPFSDLTDLLSGDTMVTISSVTPMLCHIQELCKTTEDSTQIEKTIKDGVWAYITRRFDDERVNLFYAAATVLDRRFCYQPPGIDSWPEEDDVKDFIVEMATPPAPTPSTGTPPDPPLSSEETTSHTPAEHHTGGK